MNIYTIVALIAFICYAHATKCPDSNCVVECCNKFGNRNCNLGCCQTRCGQGKTAAQAFGLCDAPSCLNECNRVLVELGAREDDRCCRSECVLCKDRGRDRGCFYLAAGTCKTPRCRPQC